VRVNIFWSLCSNAVMGISAWAVIAVIARLGTPAMLGQYWLGLAIANPLILLSDLHLRATLGTDTRRQYDFCDYLGLRLLTNSAVLASIGFVAFVVAGGREGLAVIVAVGGWKVLESTSDLCYGLLQQAERMDRVARALLLRWPASVLLLGNLLAATGSLPWGLAAGLTVRIAILLGYELPRCREVLRSTWAGGTGASAASAAAAKRVFPRFRLRLLARLALFALPLGVVQMLFSLNAAIPVYGLAYQEGESAVGLYGALAGLTAVGPLVTGAVGQAMSARLARSYGLGDRGAYFRYLRWMIGGAILLSSAGLVFVLAAGRPFLRLVYGPEYDEQVGALAWLMVAAGFDQVGSFLGWGIIATRRFTLYPFSYVPASAVAACATLLLIPGHGILGAAWAACAASACGCCLQLGVLLWTGYRSTSATTVSPHAGEIA
jgi:O-antigen/teichoic acid export membrane protein